MSFIGLVDGSEALELTLLDALARAPAAAALVVAALEEDDRKALRLVHSQLRDAVNEATTGLGLHDPDAADAADAAAAGAAARPPTPARWPRLDKLRVYAPGAAAFAALGSGTWVALGTLWVHYPTRTALDAPAARVLAAALRRMPALHSLELRDVALSDAAAEELFCGSGAMPRLRRFSICGADLSPAYARALAASGWRLDGLNLSSVPNLDAAVVEALLAAPTFAIRRLCLAACNLGAASLLAVANAPWPLEEVGLAANDFSAAAFGPALAALSRHARLRFLDTGSCRLSAGNFKARVEAAWPALASFGAGEAACTTDGPHALGAAAFAGFPALEELYLSGVALGEAGARLLASRRWPRLRMLQLNGGRIGDAGLAALARGAWPALVAIDLIGNDLGAPLAEEDARRWAPALVVVLQ